MKKLLFASLLVLPLCIIILFPFDIFFLKDPDQETVKYIENDFFKNIQADSILLYSYKKRTFSGDAILLNYSFYSDTSFIINENYYVIELTLTKHHLAACNKRNGNADRKYLLKNEDIKYIHYYSLIDKNNSSIILIKTKKGYFLFISIVWNII